MSTEVKKKKQNIVEAFAEGARNGFYIGVNQSMPNVMFAFVVIRILEITGLLAFIGRVFEPVMGVFGLPGVAATVLMGAFLSMGGGIGVAVGLFSAGYLLAPHAAILLPAVYLLGSQIQYIGRIAGTSGMPLKFTPHTVIISVLNAFGAMLFMNLFI